MLLYHSRYNAQCLLIVSLYLILSGVLLADIKKQAYKILEDKCFSCHGAKKRKGGLSLQNEALIQQGGDSGKVLYPHDAEGSLLYQRIVLDETHEDRMPPKGDLLSPEEIERLAKWINAGAAYPESVSDSVSVSERLAKSRNHWAFSPINRAAIENIGQAPDAIQTLIAKQKPAHLEWAKPAPVTKLARRLFLDLIGLPPDENQLSAFLKSVQTKGRDAAIELLVDDLLASAHFGEHWGKFWLDQAQYADSDGFEVDRVRPYAWRYRQWVIEAINQDMPFDAFVKHQLAGDLLPETGLTQKQKIDQKVATGFLACAMSNREGGSDPDHSRFLQLTERTNNFGAVFLGLTVGCAQCHEHRSDPIEQREYYQLLSFFDDFENALVDAPIQLQKTFDVQKYRHELDAILLKFDMRKPFDAWQDKMRHHASHYGKDNGWDNLFLRLRIYHDNGREILFKTEDQRSHQEQTYLVLFFMKEARRLYKQDTWSTFRIKETRHAIDQLKRKYSYPVQAMMVRARPDNSPTSIRVRGDYYRPGAGVSSAMFNMLPALNQEVKGHISPDRLALAEWLFQKRNPLTARVLMNRIWQQLFKRPIVQSVDDFGLSVKAPKHLLLLNYLVYQWQRQQWHLKPIIREIVLSETYQRDSSMTSAQRQFDPENKYFARQTRSRFTAEMIWDRILFVSGLLQKDIGGPSVKPPLPEGVIDQSIGGGTGELDWVATKEPDCFRRGIYIHMQRSSPFPLLRNFDAPTGVKPFLSRRTSVTPTQSLQLLNERIYFKASQRIAKLLIEKKGNQDQRIEWLFNRLLARPPIKAERRRMKAYLDAQRSALRHNPDAMVISGPTRADFKEVAVWTLAARVIINLDEFITRD